MKRITSGLNFTAAERAARLFTSEGSSGGMDQILTRALAGEKQAEEELFQRLLVRFMVIAKRTVSEEAEEVAQEACKTVFLKFRTETFTRGFEYWANGILRNKIGNCLQSRKRRRRRLKPESEFRQPVGSEHSERFNVLRMAIIECLKQIRRHNPMYARILNFASLGLETGEICRRLDKTPNNVYVALSRGRNLLEKCLEQGQV